MSFGVNAAPEKYQHIIIQLMARLKGVDNIADDDDDDDDDDDNHRQDMEEHGRNLIKVLERLQEKNLN